MMRLMNVGYMLARICSSATSAASLSSFQMQAKLKMFSALSFIYLKCSPSTIFLYSPEHLLHLLLYVFNMCVLIYFNFGCKC
ncbi:hypothetical protein IEQ34_002122 [Dendrobium chrysotoxum]|uniref:Secreted protein n=1 Tax=Dendrobium chrysotoxum TaxID=161865 RepID=A0AAV7HNJ9_DENCH|nr:hypothetical protein IEQ34_002122 [Dendrobium chrysotoxum]